MKILHTSDLHLMQNEDERWNTLIYLLDLGKKNEIDVFVISGDLFNKNVDAEELRPKLRDMFSNNNFKILILPGNHDKKSFRNGLYFGDDVFIFEDLYHPYEIDDVIIWGLPYEKMNSEDLYNKLNSINEKLDPNKLNILIYHGELINASFLRNDFGEEGIKRYMPVKLSYFKDFDFKYVLAGHFHSKFEVWKIEEDKYFVYSGSPISISKKETGKRKVNLFNTGEPPSEFEVDTPYFDNLTITFNPLNDNDPIEKVKQIISECEDISKICLNISGFLDCEKLELSEEELIRKIRSILPSNVIEDSYQFQDISLILEDSLFKQFNDKLNEQNFPQTKKQLMIRFVIDSMKGVKL
jgi:DNA repair protein SbcD/Mre11